MTGIVSGSTKVQASKKGGRPDLAALLVHSKHHPQGRVQIDPATGLVRNPKNNVLFEKKINVKVDGQIIGQRDVPVNGGHVKKENSVWRIPLNGPSRYHQMVLADDHRFTYMGRTDRTAPQLSDEEMEEYQLFRAYAHEAQIKIPVMRDDRAGFDAVDENFYKWLEGKDRSKVELLPMQTFQFHTSAPAVASVK